jgi:dihydrofolate reductase
MSFALRGFLPDGRTPPLSVLEIRERWRRLGPDQVERWEYEFELLDHERGVRRAFHLHHADEFIRRFHPDEDRRGGFDRGGWTASHFDDETGKVVTSVFERADALLLGRKTWEIFEAYWPHHDDEGDPVSHGINVLPKYVPSTTLTDPAWQNTHVIEGDVEAAVRELKAKPGRELQVHGSGALLRWLLERDLVDELNLQLYPVVVVARPAAVPGARPDARPGAGRVAIDAVRRHAPDLSTGRPGDVPQRRRVTPSRWLHRRAERVGLRLGPRVRPAAVPGRVRDR